MSEIIKLNIKNSIRLKLKRIINLHSYLLFIVDYLLFYIAIIISNKVFVEIENVNISMYLQHLL